MNAPYLKTVAEENAQYRAYDFIKEEILSLRFKAFDRLSAGDIAAQLEMSRTPVREALGRLEQDGLVTREATGGFHVRHISLKEITDVYRVREALEVEAALEALPYVNPQFLQTLEAILKESETFLDPAKYAEFVLVNRKFHAEIMRLSGNSVFERIMTPIIDRVRLVGAMLINLHASRQQEVFEENSKILDAFRTGNAIQVEEAVRAHVRRAREHSEQLLTSDPRRLYFDVNQ